MHEKEIAIEDAHERNKDVRRTNEAGIATTATIAMVVWDQQQERPKDVCDLEGMYNLQGCTPRWILLFYPSSDNKKHVLHA